MSFWILTLLIFALAKASGAKHHKSLSSVVIAGRVYCDTCFLQDSPIPTHFIAGASVAVECSGTDPRSSSRQEVRTDSHGEFKVQLPFSINKRVKRIEGCSVTLIRSNEPYCTVAAAATSSSLRLRSKRNRTHIFSAGFFTFRPLKQPQVCDQMPSLNNFKKLKGVDSFPPFTNPNDPSFPPPIQDPPSDPPTLGIILPPLPRLPPLPVMPQLPPLPQLPFIPPMSKQRTASKPSQLSDNTVHQAMDFAPLPPRAFPTIPFYRTPLSAVPPVFPSPPPPLLPTPTMTPVLGSVPSPPSSFPDLVPP